MPRTSKNTNQPKSNVLLFPFTKPAPVPLMPNVTVTYDLSKRYAKLSMSFSRNSKPTI